MFGSSLYFLLFVELLTVFILSSPKFIGHLDYHNLEPLLGRLFILLHLVLFMRFCVIYLFGTYFSLSLFYLILCVYFYVLGILAMFTNLGEMILCRSHPMRPSSMFPSGC